MKSPLEKDFVTRALKFIASAENSIGITSRSKNPSSQSDGFRVGMQVNHSIFGKGEITGIQGDNVTVRFASTGASRTLRKEKVTVV